jgi:hypothetical protein
MNLKTAAPLLCAGVTTYFAQLADNQSRYKAGDAGVDGLEHPIEVIDIKNVNEALNYVVVNNVRYRYITDKKTFD